LIPITPLGRVGGKACPPRRVPDPWLAFLSFTRKRESAGLSAAGGEGESLPARGSGGLPAVGGVSPRVPKTPLGRAGLPAGRQVGEMTLMFTHGG